MCPVCALRIYTERTREFRESDQLFVSWMKPRTGKSITKQRLSHWIVEAISLAYSSKGLVSPHPVYVHTQQGECQLPGLYLRESRYRIFAKQRVGPHRIHLQGSINWMLQLRL